VSPGAFEAGFQIVDPRSVELGHRNSQLFEFIHHLPSGKPTHNYGKSPFLMGKSTFSMAIFNSYVSLPEGKAKYILQLAL